MVEIIFRVSFKSKTNPCLIRDSPLKFLLISQRLTRNWGPNMKTQGGKFGGSSSESSNVPNVARAT